MQSTNERQFLIQALSQGLRLDGRNLLDNRNIVVNFGNQLGQVELSLGKTKVLCRVHSDIVEPKQERPNEGFLKFKVDFSILQEEQQIGIFKMKKYSNEINKILERIIKGSKVVDTESLSIVNGKSVWEITVDVVLLNNDGNLVDASYLGSILALLHFRQPQISVDSQNRITIFDAKEKQPKALSIHHIPIAFTYAFFENSKYLVADPTNQEELAMEGFITIAINIYNDLCSIYKPGGSPIDPSLSFQFLEVCRVKVKQMTQLIRETLANSQNFGINQQKQQCIQLDWNSILNDNLDQAGSVFDKQFQMEEEDNVQQQDNTVIKMDDLIQTLKQ